MRVLHVAEVVQGGVATVLNQLLAWQSHTWGSQCVNVIVPDRQAAHMSHLMIGQMLTYGRSGRDFISLWRLGCVVTRWVWKFKPDVVHLHSSWAGAVGRLVLLVLRPWRRPRVIFTAHGWAFAMQVPGWQMIVFAWFEVVLSWVCDVIVCVSRYEAEIALKVGICERKLRVVANGVEAPEGFVPLEKSCVGTCEKPIKALFVGRFDVQKGLDVLQEAMRLVPQVPLRVVGAPVHARTLKNGCGTMRPDANGAVLGSARTQDWCRPDAVWREMARADVVVVPSRWEGFGLVAIEAMAAGTPVLASRVGGLTELICEHPEEARTGWLVPPEDPAALAAVLASLTPAMCAEVGLRAREVWKERYRGDRMCQAYALVYAKTLAGGR